MPTYLALIYTPELDWSQPEFAEGLQEYTAFEEAHATVLRGGHALYPTTTAKSIRGGQSRQPLISDGPYAETKEALTGFYLLECADIDEALKVAAKIPAVAYGTVEVRQIHPTLDT
jgi:hypothetical protein